MRLLTLALSGGMAQSSGVNPGSPNQFEDLNCTWRCRMGVLWRFGVVVLLLLGNAVRSAEPLSEASLTRKVIPSVVTIRHLDRSGRENGVGTGFVIHEAGLIATSLHVIGESRAIEVVLSDGSRHEPIAIHAWDRKLDLAVLRLDQNGLQALPLGDSDALSSGQKVVAVGNPMGLERSVVSGVISGFRRFEHSRMIQLAIPIEPGNSGGPLFNLHGEVLGLLNMKSTLTPNLGFATPVNVLKPLLERPNTVAMPRWLRLDSLDTSRWTASMGAMWSSKVDRISVQGQGSGFGGRSLCHFIKQPETFPYELEVRVKLSDESGAAGLVFGSDGGERQYGFYPSNGQMRLTRFAGPSVYQWTILNQVKTPHYREGEWNSIKVRHEHGNIKCYVNQHLVIESSDDALPLGKVGLAKFRDTQAEFTGFNINMSPSLGETVLSDEQWQLALSRLQAFQDTPGTTPESLLENMEDMTPEQLRQMADELSDRAQQVRALSVEAHRHRVRLQLSEELSKPEGEINLLYATLLIAQHDQPSLNVSAYLEAVDDMAGEIRDKREGEPSMGEWMVSLLDYLFRENGFHGSFADYENASNSYLHRVIDDREGLPITLSVLFIELAERLGIEGVTGLPLPGHFLVKYAPAGAPVQLIDVFDGGTQLSFSEADKLAESLQQYPVDSEQMESATKAQIIRRILTNLKYVTQNNDRLAGSLPYLNLLIAIAPEDAGLRLERATIRLRAGLREGAREDFLWLLDKRPPGIRLERIRQALETL